MLSESHQTNKSFNVSGAIMSSAQADHTDISPKPIGMVVDLAESNVFAELLSVFNGGNGRVPIQYCRPEFLHFSPDEIQLSSDKTIRPVLCPKVPLPAYAGYAEVINCGKSEHNEDMASAVILRVSQTGCAAEKAIELPGPAKSSLMDSLNERLSLRAKAARLVIGTSNSKQTNSHAATDENILRLARSFSSDDEGASASVADIFYFALFDGHAGSATAILASKCLHEHIKSKLSEVLETVMLLHEEELRSDCYASKIKNDLSSNITADGLVIGALEAAFVDMDDQINAEKTGGGCAVIVALFFLNKIFVANAGDCRALVVSPTRYHQLSKDFTPRVERKRIQQIAYKYHEVINISFSRLEYSRRLTGNDLNTKVLYRDWFMDGWACKTVHHSDLKPPLILNCQKPRLLNTISVSRGFGDHHLLTADNKISIKPFLSACPEVQVFDTRSMDSLTDSDLLIMATDGFWDVLTNEEVYTIVNKFFVNSSSDGDALLENNAAIKYTLLAQELVAVARGHPVDNCRWRLSGGGAASQDDITVFVIPLKFAIDASASAFVDNDDKDILVA